MQYTRLSLHIHRLVAAEAAEECIRGSNVCDVAFISVLPLLDKLQVLHQLLYR
jgi:hypothetical protein